MASVFPGGIDSFTDPLANSSLSSPSHAGQHSDLNDAVEKVETYMGLVKVIPTGATNGTVAANGTVTIGNAVSSVSINGCFNANYRNYKVIIDVENTSTSMSLYIRWRAGGTDSTTTDYQWSYSGITNGAVTLSSNGAGQNYGYCGAFVSTTNLPFVITADVTSPFLTRETRFYNFGYYRAPAATLFGSNSHNGLTSFDGFTIYPSAGTLTGGTITVYGYRN